MGQKSSRTQSAIHQIILGITTLLLSFALVSCGGGSSDGTKKTSPTTECPNDNPYCNSKYAELKIKTPNDQMWLTLSGEYSTMQATPQGRKSGDINFADINAKELEFWSSTNPEVATVDENGLIKAVSLGKAEIIYELQIEKGVKQPARKSIIVKESASNLLPIIITDTELSVTGGETITLDASESYDDDGEITLFSWNSDKLGLIGISGEQVEISLPESNKNESYSIILEVTDNSGGISTETISISASATLPTAIGSANEAHSGEKITLNGSSSHFNGDTGAISGYKWEQINIDDGYTVELADTASQIVEFTAPELKEEDSDLGKELQFKLTVSNEAGKTASTTLTTKILNKAANIKPLALGGIESKNDLGVITLVDYLEVIEGDEVCLNGSDSTDPDVEVGSDVDSNGITSYRWSTVEDYDITTINSARGCFSAPSTKENLSIELELQVIDVESATGKKVVTLDVISQNKLPVIENISYQINNKTVYLSASVSDPDKNGSIVKYTWSENEPDISINNPSSATPTANAPIRKTDKTYTIKLTIEDDEGGKAEKSIDINVPHNNLTPTNVVINHTYTNDDKEEYQTSFLTWEASDASEYKIYKSTSNLFLFGITSTSTTSDTKFEITPELPNTTYYYKVSAIYPDGEESEHSTVQAYLPAPQDVVLVDDLKKLQFEWDSVSGADSYTIECTRENSANCSVICSESGSNVVAGTSCTHEEGIVTNAIEESTKIVISSEYTYKISANNGNTSGVINNSLKGYALADKWENITPNPGFLYYPKSAVIEKNNEHLIYFMNSDKSGYWNGSISNILFEYNYEQDKWTHKASLPEEVHGFNVESIEGNLALLSSGDNGKCPLYLYNPENNIWKKADPSETGQVSCRRGSGSANYNSDFISVGGYRYVENIISAISEVRVINIYGGLSSLPDLPSPRYNPSCSVNKNLLICFGGTDTNGNQIKKIAKLNLEDTDKEWVEYEIIADDDTFNGIHSYAGHPGYKMFEYNEDNYLIIDYSNEYGYDYNSKLYQIDIDNKLIEKFSFTDFGYNPSIVENNIITLLRNAFVNDRISITTVEQPFSTKYRQVNLTPKNLPSTITIKDSTYIFGDSGNLNDFNSIIDIYDHDNNQWEKRFMPDYNLEKISINQISGEKLFISGVNKDNKFLSFEYNTKWDSWLSIVDDNFINNTHDIFIQGHCSTSVNSDLYILGGGLSVDYEAQGYGVYKISNETNCNNLTNNLLQLNNNYCLSWVAETPQEIEIYNTSSHNNSGNCLAIENKIFSINYSYDENDIKGQLIIFNTENNSWEYGPTITDGENANDTKLVLLNNFLYMINGMSYNNDNYFSKFDLNNNKFVRERVPMNHFANELQRVDFPLFSSPTVYKGAIYFFGGDDGDGYINSSPTSAVFVYY